MQPVFQIPGELLLRTTFAMEEIDGKQINDSPCVQLWLFLCGMRHGLHIFSLAAANNFSSSARPEHTIDDKIERVAQMFVRQLVKEAKSRSTTRTIQDFNSMGVSIANENYKRLIFAFAAVSPLDFETLRSWLTNGDLRNNWIRLSFASGVEAMNLASTCGQFFTEMTRKPIKDPGRILVPEQAQKIFSIINSFANEKPSIDLFS